MNELEDIAENHPNVYRECAMAMLNVLHGAISLSVESPAAAWGVMFATSHPLCMGRSMADVATQLKVPRATISGIATRFCKEHGLPPSSYMRKEEAREMAQHIRNTIVERNKNENRTNKRDSQPNQ